MHRDLFSEEHDHFRSAFRSFLQKHAVPHGDEWEAAGVVDRNFWLRAGDEGFLAFEAPEEHGGLGIRDFRFNAVIAEEVVATGTVGDGFTMHNDIIAPYLIDFTDAEQQRRWLPDYTGGRIVAALALTEPGAGSDLAAIRTTVREDGEDLVLNGAKTFITNGSQADLALVLAREASGAGRQMSLVAVERGTPGFVPGRPMAKIGRKAQDTAELVFEDCRVPRANVIGERGGAFQLVLRNLARERLSIAVTSGAVIARSLELAVAHCQQREAFGQPLSHLQTVRHRLAELEVARQVTRSHLDRCILALNAGELSAAEAAGAKYWATELEFQTVDGCLQLFGGYGYMEEYPIARLWRDARVTRIYGGANEVMKEVVGRDLVGIRAEGDQR